MLDEYVMFFYCSFLDDLFADLGATKKTKSKAKKISLDDDDLFGDPLGGLK